MTRRKNTLEELAPNVATPTCAFVEEMIPATFDADGVQVSSAIGSDGKEYPDPVPMSAPLGYEPPVPLGDMMKMMIQEQLRPENDFEIEDSEEEANDFETDDDRPDPLTPFEQVFVPKVPLKPEPAAPVSPPAPAPTPEPVLDSSVLDDTKKQKSGS